MTQQNNPETRKKTLVRLLALIVALIVLGGSIFAFFASSGNARSARLPLQGAQAAQETAKPWKDLKKGGSGNEVKRAQQALKELGYYEGKTDGNFSKAFEEAVLSFQKDFELPANGVIDQELYLLLTDDLPEESPSPSPTPRPAATATPGKASATPAASPSPAYVVRGEKYSDKDHVAAYLKAYGELPPNYITKSEATALGWVNSLGNLWRVAPGKSIGGDPFGNYEGKLPVAKGRKYYECDIDFDGGYRNGKRIIFSSDGLIFYTEDHYNTFEEIK